MTKSIGILLTNPDRRPARLAFPNDGEQVRDLLAARRPAFAQTIYDAVAGELPASADSHDGYVITGSPASVNDDAPWVLALLEFLRQLDAARTPTVGLCFGHQAIVRALGGTVAEGAGWDFGVATTRFHTPQPWMTPTQPTLRLFSAHHEQVVELPTGFEIIGGNEFCPNGALKKGTHIFTTQYHPEMSEQFMMVLADWLEEDIGKDAIARSREQIHAGAQGLEFAEWMVRFLEMERSSEA